MRNRIPRFDALPLSHRDSTVSEVYYEVLFTNITLSTLLILAVRRTRVIWTSSETSLTMESLWLSGRASESGIRRSEVRFVIGTQNFSLSHASDKTKIIFISLPNSSTQDRGHSFSQQRYGCTRRLKRALPLPVARDKKIRTVLRRIRSQDSLPCPLRKT